jgi:hypothetical protein
MCFAFPNRTEEQPMARSHDGSGKSSVALMLTGGRVLAGFRASLFAAANRAGMSVNEFVLRAAGDQLLAGGADFPGVFEPGDAGQDLLPRGRSNRTEPTKQAA